MLQRILLLLLTLTQVCFSQLPAQQSFYEIEMPEASGEEIILETDRQLYCIDEKIYFTVGYQFNHAFDDVQWSKIIYVELIRWNGEKITQAKFSLSGLGASGSLTIPNSLLSGQYYLRAYTKWMRNFPVEDYTYKLIKVINPFDAKIDTGPVREPVNGIEHSPHLEINSANGIECITDKSTYHQREKVDLTVRLNSGETEYSNFCISVAKAAYIDTNQRFKPIPDQVTPVQKSLIYLPETRGISVSGKIVNANAGTFDAQATLQLSMPQNWKYYSTCRTREHGKFYFTLPDFYGEYDFYIDAVLGNEESADILIDNDYCNRNILLPYFPFFLDSLEKKVASEMIVNMQLNNSYKENGNTLTASNQLPFYGSPKRVYYTEKYVQLPNLEEFIFELVTEVRTIRSQNEAYLKLLGYNQYRNLSPLVLLDNIPVSDVNELLQIPLARIEKVEIFDQPYIVSGIKYSGVIGISTKKKDIAGIELNKNSQFFSYDLLSDGHFQLPDYSSTDTTRNIYRHNLLFWEPDIELKPDQPQTVSFYTSDSKGEYIVYIRSANAVGTPGLYATKRIVVE